jgi:serine/threonine protein kinase/Tfp pilus assembly protein PilF
MQPIDDFDDMSQDDRWPTEAELLVKYEEAKAAGGDMASEVLIGDVAREDLACVDLLHRVWPDFARSDAAHKSPALKTLGDFRILRELGRGGMGTVFEAEQVSMGRHVALKVLPFAALLHEKSLRRFQNEVRAAASLDHPHIVSVYSIGEERGVHFYAMQLIRGRTLAELIDELRRREKSVGSSPLSVAPRPAVLATDNGLLAMDTQPLAAPSTRPDLNAREHFRAMARLGIQAAEALQHAHDQGVLHRDIKPGNLLLDRERKLYVTDFGLARMETDAGLTMTGDIIGTLRYMAPEQALAQRVVIDHRADIYSLGATLYELLTLEPAFCETDSSVLLRQIALEEPLPLRKLDRQIPDELETIVLKAMAKDADERYQSAEELADDLKAFLEHRPIRAKPPAMWNRVAKWSRRHVAIVWAAALILLATTIISAVSGFLITGAYHRESAEREFAESQRRRAEVQREQAESNFRKAREAVYAGLIRYGPTDSNAVEELKRVCDALMGMSSKPGKSDEEIRDELVALAREVAKRNPENVLNQYYLGLVLSQQRQYEESIAALREADRLQPETPFILDKLAWKLATCPDETFRDPQEAVEFAKRAVKLAPQDGVYLNTLGVAHYRAGDWQTALGELQKARGLHGNVGDFNEFFLAMCYRRQGDHDAARKWYTKAVEQMEKMHFSDDRFIPIRAETEQLLGYSQSESLKVE